MKDQLNLNLLVSALFKRKEILYLQTITPKG